MTAPTAILVVPTEAGAALLADGACGGRPPAVRWMPRMDDGRGRWVEPAASRGGHPGSVIALPLWWAGALVPEGWDRAERVWVAAYPRAAYPRAAYPRRCRMSDLDMCASRTLLLAEAVEADGLCRVVLLDLVDGRLVERAP